MDFQVNFVEGNGYVFVSTSGIPSPEDIDLMLHGILDNPLWNPTSNIILDNSRLKLEKLHPRQIQNLSDVFRKYNKELSRSNIVIVATSDIEFGLSRMLQAYAGDSVTFLPYICRSFDEALSWIKQREMKPI